MEKEVVFFEIFNFKFRNFLGNFKDFFSDLRVFLQKKTFDI